MTLKELAATASVKIVNKPCVIGLPPGMYVEYFGEQGGTYFIIYRPAVDWEYTDFVCLISHIDANIFMPVAIKKVTRYRDGGTTDIELEGGGAFHFPTSLYGEKLDNPPTFNGEPITLYENS